MRHHFSKIFHNIFIRDRRGSVAIMGAMLIPPTIMIFGMLVDYARLQEYQTALQHAVDNAALAGASAYTDASQSSAAVQAAQNSFASSQLPSAISNIALDTPIASQGATNQAGTANNVVVGATGTVNLTFLSIVAPATVIAATARGSNPVVTFSMTQGNFGSTAGDWNAVYVYAVPTNSLGQLDFTKVPNPTTILANGDEVGSNCNAGTTEYCVYQPGGIIKATAPKLTITATTVIGFALENVTAGRGCCGYTNQYGARTDQANWFFSSLLGASLPPSAYTDLYEVQNGYTGTHYSTAGTGVGLTNCSLQIQLLPAGSALPAAPTTTGKCLSPTDVKSGAAYTNLTCTQLNGRILMFWWNDMGANPDNYNWNDVYYTISCAAASGPARVLLTQ